MRKLVVILSLALIICSFCLYRAHRKINKLKVFQARIYEIVPLDVLEGLDIDEVDE